MKWSLTWGCISLVIALLLPASSRAEMAPLPPCFLYEAGLANDPVTTRNPHFRKAFKAHKKRKWKRADKLFSKEIRQIVKKGIEIFQSPRDEEITNDEIQRFLTRYVLKKHPTLLAGSADFRFAPEIALATAEARCKSGDSKNALSILQESKRQDHLHIPLARAVVSLELKQPKAALHELEQSVHGDQWRGRLVRALALVQLDRMTEARREVESSLNSCVGPAQCDLATTVQQALFPDTEKGGP